MAKNGLGGLAVLILLIAVVGGGILLLGGKLPTESIVSPNTQQLQIQCTSDTTPEIKMVAAESINTQTLITDINAYTYRNGAFSEVSLLSTDALHDATAGDAYTVYFFDDSGAKKYYGKAVSGNVQCKEINDVAVSLDRVGSATAVAYNTESDTNANGTKKSGNALPVAAGETVKSQIKFSGGTNDRVFGSDGYADGLVLCANYDATDFAKVDVTNVGVVGTIAVPFGAGSGNATRDTDKCFQLEQKSIKEFDTFRPVLVLEAGTTNPSDSNVVVTLWDQWLMQDDTGAWIVDVTDPDTGADLGVAKPTATIYTA